MKISKTFFIFLFFMNHSNFVLAHGGEDHGENPTPTQASNDSTVTHETSSDQIELVLKHPKIIPGHETDLTLFVSHANSNKPISDIKIDFELSGLEEKINFTPYKQGQFLAHAKFPKDGDYTAVISVSGAINDLLMINEITVGDTQKSNSNNMPYGWIMGLGIVFLIFILFLFKKLRVKKLNCQILAILHLSIFLTFSSSVFAHGGEDHGEQNSNHSQGLSNQVILPKESQFLIEIETAIATKNNVFSMVVTQGTVVPKPSGNQDLLAMNSGRLRDVSGKIPTVGQVVKKGAILGTLESIGTLSFKAPFDGIITFSDFHPGQWVEAGSKIFTVVDPTILWIEAPLFEKDFSKVKKESVATLIFEGTDQNQEGEILNIGQSIDKQTRSALVTIEIKNPEYAIKVGQWAKIYLETKENVEALVIPKSSLLMKDGMPMVFVKKHAEIFEGRAVMVVGEYKNQVYISNGINEKEKVVINGGYQLLPLLKTLSVGK